MDADFILKLAKLFLIAVEDRLSWLREGLKPLKERAEDKTVFSKLEQITAQPMAYNWREGFGEYNDVIKNELTEIIKYFMREQDYEASRNARELYRLFTETGEEKNRYLRNQPRREFAAPGQYFYHGTNAADAFSILKNKTVLRGSAFTNFSLTADLTAAAKFGDIIFVFDAKKIQRLGAKKMRYYPEKTWLQEVGEKNRETESYENPFIADIYMYEQEWALPLPFTFKDELVKILILRMSVDEKGDLGYGGAPAERKKALLETVADVPIEITFLPSYSKNHPDITKEEDVERANLRHVVYNKILQPLDTFKEKAQEIAAQIKKKINEEYGEGSDTAKYIYKHDQDIRIMNSLYGNIKEPFSHGTSNWDRYFDLKKVLDAINIHDIDRFRYTKLEPLMPYLQSIADAKDDVLNVWKETYLKNDEDYAKAIMGYNSSYVFQLKPELAHWIDANPEKFVQLVLNSKQYADQIEHNHGRQPGYIESIVEDITNVEALPDEFWRKHPVLLLDHKYLHRMPKDRIRNIFSNNDKYHFLVWSEYSNEDHVRGGHRRERILKENEENYQEVIKILDEEGIVSKQEQSSNEN